ncbi:MAG TPA: hypothetical protein VFO36_03560 [Nitrospiraceae bacterium]|nr:hypothetical protein [Nitrospiraceae bacterium]
MLRSEPPECLAQLFCLGLRGFGIGLDALGSRGARVRGCTQLRAVCLRVIACDPEALGCPAVGSGLMGVLGEEASLIARQSIAGGRIGVR